MALALNDRVQQQGTANTTVSFTLTASVAGFQSFAVIGNGNTTYYSATDASGNWEVGIGTYSTTGPTLTRNTILSSSNSNTAVTFSGVVNVFVTYPSEKSVNLDGSDNVSALGTVSSGTWQGSTIGVAYGGTGVTTSSGANSVMLRDSNQNVAVNRLNQSNTNTTAAGGVTALTTASSYIHTLSGTGNQTYTMPDATTLSTGVAFLFNNMATGTLTLQDYATGSIGTIPSGGAGAVFLTVNATVGGTWDLHAYLPEGVTFGTNAFNLGTSVITGGTWNGGTIGTAYGGTGLTSFSAANYALYSTSSSALTAGTLPVAAGGTNVTSFTANGIVYGNGTSALGVTAAGTTGQVLLANTSGAPTWGSVPTTGAVTSISFGSIGLTPSSATTGAVTVSGTLNATSGGTNISSYAVGDLLFANTTTSLDRIPVGTNGYVLTSNGTAPAWSAIPSNVASFQTSLNGLTPSTATTGAVTLAGTLGATSGGTSQSTYTTGDIIYASATNTLSKLPIGTSGQVLSISSGVPSWSSASGSTTLTTDSFTATAGQTSFSVTYTPALLQGVYRNGVKLDPSDYTATSGTAIVLNTGANLGDNIQVQYFSSLATTTAVNSISFGSTGLTPSTASTGIVNVAGTLGSGYGGTGFSTYATGDLVYASATNTLSKLTAGTNGYVLTLSGGVPSWQANSGVTSFQTSLTGLTPSTSTTGAITLAGTLGVASGGTGSTTFTAYGVLAGGTTSTGAVQSVVSVGTSGQVLVSNGAGALPTFQTVTAGATISNDTSTASTLYPLFAAATSGTPTTIYTSDSNYLYQPSNGALRAKEMEASNGLIVNNATIASNYTIPTGYNASSVGPVTVSSGAAVTIPSGSRWLVL
jgi:hypothetical protein